MDLISDEVIAELGGVVAGDAVEEGGDFNNPGGLFVVGDFVGAGEESRIVLGDLGEIGGADVVRPDLGDAVVSARVFLKDDVAVRTHGDVVKHQLAFAAIEQHLDGAALLGVGAVCEFQGPEAASGGGGGSGGEVEGFAIEAPGPVFRSVEVGDSSCGASGVEFGSGFALYITEVDQGEAAAAIGEGEAGFSGLGEIGHLLGGGGACTNLDPEQLASGKTGFFNGVAGGCLGADVHVHLAIDSAVIEGNGDGLGLLLGVGKDVLKGEVAEGGKFVDAAGFCASHDVGKGAALCTGFFSGEVDAAVVTGSGGLEGGGGCQITRAEAREGGGGAVGPGGAGGVGQVEVVGRLEEVAAGHHRQGGLVDHEIGHIGALGAMGAGDPGGVGKFMIYQHPQGGAVIDHTNAVGCSVKAEAVVGLFTRGDDFLEGTAIFGANQEVAAREGLLGDVGVRHRIEDAGPGVVGVSGEIDELLTQLQSGLNDFFALSPVAIPGIEVVGNFSGFTEQCLLFSRERLAGS